MATNQYIQEKITLIRNWMRAQKLDGLLLTHNIDQFYLTDFYFYPDEALFLITPKKAYALTRGLYEEPFGKYVPDMNVIGYDANRVERVVQLMQELRLKRVGFDPTKALYTSGTQFRKAGCVEVPSIVTQLRTAKKPYELKRLRAANRLAYLTYEYVRPRIKTGMRESEVAAEMEYFMRVHGAKGTSFFTIVAFGPNTANPHHETSTRKLKANEAILLDFGCVLDGYCSDMTRSWWHGAKEPAEYGRIWRLVDTARKRGIKAATIGTVCKEVDATCRNLISQAGYGDYFTHGTGHGVGIEIHEDPYNNQSSLYVLQEGNVVTVEPGIYLPGKYGVRLEDTVAISKTGAKILTKE